MKVVVEDLGPGEDSVVDLGDCRAAGVYGMAEFGRC
jgi:hypothetical protein